MNKQFYLLLAFISFCFIRNASAQKEQKAVIAYFSGPIERLDSFNLNNITHIIYCFGHLSGNRLSIGSAKDSALLKKMAALKQKKPSLKALVSLGGWGGCEPCSEVFSKPEGRLEFAKSVKAVNDYFKVDGIDLDWEYPVVEGYPGHRFSPDDKNNFTELVRQLRTTLGRKQLITFAAGGFQKYLDEAIDWEPVMKTVDYVNLMTYDLVNGYATVTGHHTPLYSTSRQQESIDNCVQDLIRKGIPPSKMIVGSAFYGRMWENVPDTANGLYQPGKFKTYVPYNTFARDVSTDSGFVYHWDEQAHAPYAYNPKRGLYVTFDDTRSISQKTKYVIDNKLGGIMFWELSIDSPGNGLLDAIHQTLQSPAK